MSIVKFVRVGVFIVFLTLGMLLVWQFNEGDLAKHNAIFQGLILSGIFFLFETFFIIYSKECSAKGVVITRDNNPFAYGLVLMIAVLLCTSSFIAAYLL